MSAAGSIWMLLMTFILMVLVLLSLLLGLMLLLKMFGRLMSRGFCSVCSCCCASERQLTPCSTQPRRSSRSYSPAGAPPSTSPAQLAAAIDVSMATSRPLLPRSASLWKESAAIAFKIIDSTDMLLRAFQKSKSKIKILQCQNKKQNRNWRSKVKNTWRLSVADTRARSVDRSPAWPEETATLPWFLIFNEIVGKNENEHLKCTNN